MEKGANAYRTISEVAEDLDLPQHVLRFWEMRFSQIKPMKRSGGRRFYRPEDIDLLRGIKRLLYGEGYTIKGVQRILKEQGARFAIAAGRGEPISTVVARHEPSSTEGSSTEGSSTAQRLEGVSAAPAFGSVADWGAFPPPPPPPASKSFSAMGADDKLENVFSGQQLRILRASLAEIVECSRLLSAARQS